MLQVGDLAEELQGFFGAMAQDRPTLHPTESLRLLHEEGDRRILHVQDIDRLAAQQLEQMPCERGLLQLINRTEVQPPEASPRPSRQPLCLWSPAVASREDALVGQVGSPATLAQDHGMTALEEGTS